MNVSLRRPGERRWVGDPKRSVRAERSDAALGGASKPRPILINAHPQAAGAERRWQPDRVAVEAVEREQGSVAQPAPLEGFELHVVPDGSRSARQHPAAAFAQAQ